MPASAPDRSIVRRDSPRPDLLTFEIRAKITKPDIEWMAAEADAAFDRFDAVDMLIVMSNYDGAELGALFDGDAIGVQARAASHVRRYAVVGAPAWAEAMINLFAPLTPVEEKTFALEDEAEARLWVDGSARAAPAA
jgi:hypothetical protein